MASRPKSLSYRQLDASGVLRALGPITLMLYPPEDLASLERKPMEMIFVLDCSGSMSGQPIAQVRTAIERALKHLQPDDTFQIIRFSNHASTGPTDELQN